MTKPTKWHVRPAKTDQPHAYGCWQQHTAVLDDNMSQVCDEIFIDVHKLLKMCIVLKALHTLNAC